MDCIELVGKHIVAGCTLVERSVLAANLDVGSHQHQEHRVRALAVVGFACSSAALRSAWKNCLPHDMLLHRMIVLRGSHSMLEDTTHHPLYQSLVPCADNDLGQAAEEQKYCTVFVVLASPGRCHTGLVDRGRSGGMSCRRLRGLLLN